MRFKNCGEHEEFWQETRKPGERIYGRDSTWYVGSEDIEGDRWEMSEGPFASEEIARKALLVEEIASFIEEELGDDEVNGNNANTFDVADLVRERFGSGE